MTKFTLDGELVAEFQLCEDRHGDCPVAESIFPNTVAIMAFGKMELQALQVLKPLSERGLKRLVIYTSGCQSCLVAVLNVAWRLKIRDVVVMHYDTVYHGWQAQRVATVNDVY